jgi:hypothetical protein
MYLLEDQLSVSNVIVIPSKTENCYNEMEYQAFDNMMDLF